MQKTKKVIFNLVLFGIISVLLFVLLRYDKNYWLNYANIEYLPLKYGILINIAQIIIVSLIISLMAFRKWVYKRVKEIILMLSSALLFFIFLEIASRAYLCNFADPSIQEKILLYGQCNIAPKYSPHHYLNYHLTPNFKSPDGMNIHNSMGFRGPEIEIPKPKDVYRIATLGGSTTYTTGVKDWKKDFARQLERELQKKYNYSKIEVINAGVGGYNSLESLINLKLKVLDLEPDLIIIYDGVNDVKTRLVIPDFYKSDNSGVRKQWKEGKFPIIFRFTLIRLLTGINPSGLSLFVDNTENRVPSDMSNEEVLEKNKPIYFERNLIDMAAIAKAHKIDLLLAMFAYSDEFEYFKTKPYYKKGIAENNEVIKKVGREQFILVYDFASQMPTERKYWVDGVHLNEEGSKLKGELFANFIYKSRLIDKKLNDIKNAKE